MANNPAPQFVTPMLLAGRTKIIVDFTEVTEDNVLDILALVQPIHSKNSTEINYLYNYYKGIQPILSKTREFQQEINNKVVENRASQIVNFKHDQVMRKPIQFVSAEGAENSEEINLLNRIMRLCHKHKADKQIVKWMLICGIGYRFTMQNDPKYSWEQIIKTNALDPRNTESVYSSDWDTHLLMTYTHRKTKILGLEVDEFMVYTDTTCFHILDGKIIDTYNFFTNGENPITPYELNDERIGAFEWVINLLDNINEVQSGRLDSLDQFINSLLLFHNVDIDDDGIKKLRELNAVVFGDRTADMPGEITYLNSELNQSQVQTLVDYMWQAVLEIVGMPNRNGGSSTSDTGTATTLRDGHSDAEARAAEIEEQFTESEEHFIITICNILSTNNVVRIDPTDVGVKFTRRIFENMQSKAQTITTLLGSDKIAPRLAFIASDIWQDPEEAWQESYEWYMNHQEDPNGIPDQPGDGVDDTQED